MNKIKHIYWFAPYNLTCPSTRYRGKIPLEYAKKNHAISYDFVTPNRSLKGGLLFLSIFLKIFLFRKKNSLIVIQKICSNRFYAKALKFLVFIRNKATLYDIDDAEYYRQKTKSLHFFLKNCEYVQVGSEALRKYCLKFNPNVYISTSPVHEHGIRKLNKNATIHIGWVGDLGNGNPISKSFSHKTSIFEILLPCIIQIKYPIKLSIVGVKNPNDIPLIKDYLKEYPHIQLEIPTSLDWIKDDWVYSKIMEFDIGVSPMVNHPFNQAKSAFKAKQYLSCGVPTVASDIGENKKFVVHKKNGFICNSSLNFLDAINKINQMDPSEYYQYVENCLNTLDNFSIRNYCKLLLDNKTKH